MKRASIALFACLLFAVFALSAVAAGTAYKERIGTGVGSADFVDAAKTLRAWEAPFGGAVALDANGWPLEDAKTVFFDMRPPCQWLGDDQIDDPDAYHRDMGGVYKLSYTGRGKPVITDDPREYHEVRNLRYDKRTNTTTADIVVDNEWPLLVVAFFNTGKGVKNVRLIRPGYADRPNQTFTDAFVDLAGRFKILRYMGFTDTNTFQGEFWNTGSILEWRDRKLVTDATQGAWGRKNGAIAWEYAIALANQTGTDMWINIPVNASHAYIKELAKLVKATLKPELRVYLEYSNEVWNWGFRQSVWNQAAAEAEVASGKSILNADGNNDKFAWGRRRYIREVWDIARIFGDVFGRDQFPSRLRPVHAWQFGGGEWGFNEQLEWADKTLGPVKTWLYGTSVAPYFNIEGLRKPVDKLADAPVEGILEAMRASSDDSVRMRARIGAIAKRFGLAYLTYEGGSDTSIQDGTDNTVNVANRIRAERAPGMRDLVVRDLVDNWFGIGGDAFVFLELVGYYTRYGGWGLVEDTGKPDSPKMRAVLDVMAMDK